MIDFGIPKEKHRHELSEAEKDAYSIKPRPLISDWFQDNIKLVEGGYTNSGIIKFHKWQIEPTDCLINDDREIICAHVQSGKSMIADAVMMYAMAVLGINGNMAYAEAETARLVFKVRLVEMIKQNKCLCDLWDGKEDNLTIENILLRRSFWRVSSAQNKNTLATFPAGLIIGSEVGKWKRMPYNPVLMLYGRQESYAYGMKKSLLESSPYEIGDYLFQEMYKDGTLILQPKVKCPTCGEYQFLKDTNIKLRNEDMPHNPAFIRAEKENVVMYECDICKQEIKEKDRYLMGQEMVWAAPDITETFDDGFVFKQKAEIVSKSGTILSDRIKYDTKCFNPNRLIDINFPFWECLARFFDSVHNPERKKVYETETMARYPRSKNYRNIAVMIETKKSDYATKGDNVFVPDDVLVCTCGIDTMDQDFYGVILGWGAGLKCYVLRFEKIYCPMMKDDKADRKIVLDAIKNNFISPTMFKRSGVPVPIKLGFMDRGGHRPLDVDYVVNNIPFIKAYIGSTKISGQRDLIIKSETGHWYLGQSQIFSDTIGQLMETDLFVLPSNISSDFINQACNQFTIKKKSKDGVVENVFIKKDPDHYRDCLNMAYAAAHCLDLGTALFDERIVRALITQQNKEIMQEREEIKPMENNKQSTNRNVDGRLRDLYR